MLDFPLTAAGKKAWDKWAKVIPIMVKLGGVCHPFTAKVPPKPAVCCSIPISFRNPVTYAFCVLEEKLQFHYVIKAEMGKKKKKKKKNAKQVTKTAMMETTRTNYREGETTYINLLEVPCDPPIDEGLCSQYVSSAASFRVSSGSP